MEEIQLTSEKSFQIELSSDKNNSYSLEFNLNNYIEIIANQINNIINKSYSSKYSFEEIRETKYFLQFDNLDEIFDEIKDIIYNNKIIIKENNNNLILNIPLPEKKEIIFELKSVIKNSNDRFNELTDLIMKLNAELTTIKNEEITNLQKEINNMKSNEEKLINENTLLRSENFKLKKDVSELKEKINILWNENKMINNLDSKIISRNKKYNEILKYWINPFKKLRAELLYRLSENGDNISTFHELCDNKGPSLTLFHVNDENIVGIYTPLSWDSSFLGYWKKDMDTFIFNLNKNQKYKKLKNECSIKCDSSNGPCTADFGADFSMKSISHYANYINKYFDKGSDILPSNNQKKEYDLIEAEIYQIILE